MHGTNNIPHSAQWELPVGHVYFLRSTPSSFECKPTILGSVKLKTEPETVRITHYKIILAGYISHVKQILISWHLNKYKNNFSLIRQNSYERNAFNATVHTASIWGLLVDTLIYHTLTMIDSFYDDNTARVFCDWFFPCYRNHMCIGMWYVCV